MINRKKLSQIKCIVVEVDGVLHKQHQFSARDSMMIRRLIKAGYGFAVVLNSESSHDDQEIFEHFERLGVRNYLRNRNGKIELNEFLHAHEASENECALLFASQVRTSVEQVMVGELGEAALAEFGQIILDHRFNSSSSQTIARKVVNT